VVIAYFKALSQNFSGRTVIMITSVLVEILPVYEARVLNTTPPLT